MRALEPANDVTASVRAAGAVLFATAALIATGVAVTISPRAAAALGLVGMGLLAGFCLGRKLLALALSASFVVLLGTPYSALNSTASGIRQIAVAAALFSLSATCPVLIRRRSEFAPRVGHLVLSVLLVSVAGACAAELHGEHRGYVTLPLFWIAGGATGMALSRLESTFAILSTIRVFGLLVAATGVYERFAGRSVLGLLLGPGHLIWGTSVATRAPSLLGHPLASSVFLAVSFSCWLGGRRSLIRALALALILAGLWATASASGYCLAAVALILHFRPWARGPVAAVASAFVAASAVLLLLAAPSIDTRMAGVPTSHSYVQRHVAASATWSYTVACPVCLLAPSGVGTAASKLATDTAFEAQTDGSHAVDDQFLSFAIDLGLLPTMFVIVCLLLLIRRSRVDQVVFSNALALSLGSWLILDGAYWVALATVTACLSGVLASRRVG